MIMRFFENGFAPGMVQAYPVSDKHEAAILKDMQANGYPDGAMDTVLLSHEELPGLIPAKAIRAIDEGYSVNCRVDNWTARQLFGWSKA